MKIKNQVKPKKIPRYFEKLWERENWYTLQEHKNKIKEKALKNAVEERKAYSTSAPIDNRPEIALNTLKTNLTNKAKLLLRKL